MVERCFLALVLNGVNCLIFAKMKLKQGAVVRRPLASALPAEKNGNSSSRAKAIFLILLLLSLGLSAPIGSAIQSYEFDHGFFQFNFLPVTQPSGPNDGGAFFSGVFVQGGITSDSYSPTSAEGETLSSLSQIPFIGSGVNYFYAREGNTYTVFPENILENGGSPLSLVAFAPLLSVWLDSERRRSRFRIYVEILDLLKKGPITPYEISFQLRLNSKRTKEYIEFLADKRFLDCSDQEGRLLCAITTSGATFVDNLRTILDENG
jgi:predicted transcriptional regulator